MVLAYFFTISTNAQVGIGTTNPDTSSILDITATDKGVLVPRVNLSDVTNTTTPIVSPAIGLLVWNTNVSVNGGNGIGFYFFNGSQWMPIQEIYEDHDFYEVGTTNAPDDINNDIYRLGNLALGQTTATYMLDILDENSSASAINVNHDISNNFLQPNELPSMRISQNTANYSGGNLSVLRLESDSGLPSDIHKGLTTSSIYSSSQIKIGVQNVIENGNGQHFGVLNNMGGISQGSRIGTYNRLTSSTINNPYFTGVPTTELMHCGIYNEVLNGLGRKIYGTYNHVRSNSPILNDVIGVYNKVEGGGGGTLYGAYNHIVNAVSNELVGNQIQIDALGSGPKYGLRVYMPLNISDPTPNHFGVYSVALDNRDNTEVYAGYFLGKVSIGTSGTNEYILPLSRGLENQIIQTDATGNLSWVDIPANGDITAVHAGFGLEGGGTIGAPTITARANNGLNVDAAADAIQLGGNLLENTTITQGNSNMRYNLNGNGDFSIDEDGIPHFQVRDNGLSYFGDDTYWNDESTNGTTIASIIDDTDDGRFRIYENGIASVDLDANSQFIFNEQGLDRNFRVESDASTNMFLIDAGLNNIGIKTATPDKNLHLNIDRYTGASGSGGLKIQQSHTGNAWTIYASQSSNNLVLYYNNVVTGAFDNTTGVYSATSDNRLKKNIKDIKGSLNKLMLLQPKTYHFKTQNNNDSKTPGFIAQDVRKIFPDLVKVIEDDTNGNGLSNLHTLSYTEFIPYIIKGVQEQQEIIENQNERIDKLEKEIEELKTLIKSKMN